MNVPSLDLKAQYASLKEEMSQRILDVLGSQGFVLGPEVDALEKELAAVHGTAHAIGVSSGSDALLVALMALGIGAGDSVVTTPFSFFSTAGSVVRLGAKPIFCDIDEKSFNLSPEALGKILKKEIRDKDARIKVVLPGADIKVAGGRETNLRSLQSWIFYAGATSCMIGNYLTTAGKAPQEDLQMLQDLNLDVVTQFPKIG